MKLLLKIKSLFFYFTVFITGAAILVIEILGTRILTPFYGSTIYVWSSLITVTLLFLALGYFFGGKLADKKPKLNLLYWIIFFAGISILLIPKYSNWLLILTDRFGLKFGPLISAFFLFFAPLFLLGMVSPFAVKIRTQALDNLGIIVGNLYALATLGSLVGALLTGFYLIPNFPVTRIINITGMVLVLLFFLWQIQSVGKLRKIILTFLLFLIISLLPSYYFNPSNQKSSWKLIYHTQSFYGDIKVIKFNSLECLFVNGIGQSCVDKRKKESRFFYFQEISDVINQRSPKTMLALGMGGGSFLFYVPENTRIDVVEIDPKIIKIAEKYDLIPERKYKIYYDDARHFIRKTNKKYDMIVMDLFIGGSTPSYMLSEESFKEIKKILTKNGMLYIHFPASSQEEEDLFLASVHKTLTEVFDEAAIISINSIEGSIGIIVEVLPSNATEWEAFNKINNLNLAKADFITDDFNPLEDYYLSRLFSIISYYNKYFGKEVFFVN